MTLGDLPHKGETNTPPAPGLARSGRSEKAFEHAVAQFRRDARAAILHFDDNRRLAIHHVMPKRDLDRSGAVFDRILDHVADQAAQQRR